MVHAFVMVKTETGASGRIRDALAKIAGVSEAHVVAGEYDVVTELDGEDVREILQTVSEEFQSQAGLTETKTYVGLGDR
jgi:DNA-binding Lrp family transcriptional regulator